MQLVNFVKEIIRYFNKNKGVLIFFFLAILMGFTNIFGYGPDDSYRTWELSAFLYTLGYTGVFYWFGFKNGYFRDLGGEKSISIGLAVLLLSVITLFIANDFIHLFSFNPDRLIRLILLVLFAGIFSIINWALHRHFEEKADSATGYTEEQTHSKEKLLHLSNDFRSTVFMSDLPLTIAFFVLTIYCIFNNSVDEMDYFYSGAVAFEMMYSNAVWIFNDDKIFEKLV